MDILILLIPVTMLLITAASLFFWWSIKAGQYDDLDSPAQRILFDDDDHLIPRDIHKDTQKDQSND